MFFLSPDQISSSSQFANKLMLVSSSLGSSSGNVSPKGLVLKNDRTCAHLAPREPPFGARTLRGPTLRGPTLRGPTLLGSTLLGLHPFGARICEVIQLTTLPLLLCGDPRDRIWQRPHVASHVAVWRPGSTVTVSLSGWRMVGVFTQKIVASTLHCASDLLFVVAPR